MSARRGPGLRPGDGPRHCPAGGSCRLSAAKWRLLFQAGAPADAVGGERPGRPCVCQEVPQLGSAVLGTRLGLVRQRGAQGVVGNRNSWPKGWDWHKEPEEVG